MGWEAGYFRFDWIADDIDENQMKHWLDHPPPWNVFPQMSPDELGATQGAEEAWLDSSWRPFWLALDAAQQESYFDHLQASAAWREAIHFVCDPPPGFDAAQDAADSQGYLDALAAGRDRKPSLLERLSALWRRR